MVFLGFFCFPIINFQNLEKEKEYRAANFSVRKKHPAGFFSRIFDLGRKINAHICNIYASIHVHSARPCALVAVPTSQDVFVHPSVPTHTRGDTGAFSTGKQPPERLAPTVPGGELGAADGGRRSRGARRGRSDKLKGSHLLCIAANGSCLQCISIGAVRRRESSPS